ncbi:MAG TPA: hypothetical protein EYP08_08710 [Pyrodictiaceae archaeon]|nr:hypothetical protein [Pyrodictiaceae archaeon]HIQ11210.1 hypothetical protein [Pyrodictium sp.]
MVFTKILITLVFYFTLIVVVYLLSTIVSERTPIKVTIIATIAAIVAQLLASGIKQAIQP